MNIWLIVTIGIIVVLIGVICWLMYMAVVFTNEHNATVSAFRKAKAKISDLKNDVNMLNHKLDNEEVEVEKWKTKAIEISINAQKGEKVTDDEKSE